MKRDRTRTSAAIAPEPGGPLKVSGLTAFRNSRGEPITVRESMRVCRCGASKTKPFCDSTHVDIGFSDQKSDERVPDQLDVYGGQEVTILDNRGICSHAGFCTSGLPEVWRASVEPWVDADAADRDAIVGTIRKCPSGALSYQVDGRVETEFNDDAEIHVARDGPYRVRGGVKLEGVEFADGASREHYALCRCGGSRNKPFCDGSHWFVGFKDDEARTPGERSMGVAHTRAAPLTEGVVCDGALRCPWHGHDFNLMTGKGVGNPDRAETFKVREGTGGSGRPACRTPTSQSSHGSAAVSASG